jgi:hypothetical protein
LTAARGGAYTAQAMNPTMSLTLLGLITLLALPGLPGASAH